MLITIIARPAPAVADASGQGGDFVAFATPTRALDTRSGIGGVTGKLAAAGSATFSVLGVGAVPTSGVSAVLVKLVAIGPSANTYLEVWPDGTTRPSRTLLAAGDGETISNTAVVQPGANGKLGVYNSVGTTHVVVDVLGYYQSASDGTGGGFVPVVQKRFVDTRSGIGTSAGTIAAGAGRTVTFTGGVVPAGASAVFVNLMVVGASASGSVTAVPAGTTPGYPALNHVAGTTSSGVSVKLSADGRATFTNGGSAAIDLVVDVEGYFTATSTTGAGLRKVANRLLDTRSTTAVAAGGTVDVVVAGTSGLPTRGVAGAVLNLIVPNPGQSGSISAWSVGDTATGYSMMHFLDGTTRAGLTVLEPGTDGKVRIKNNSSGAIDVVVDLQGWYADPIPAVAVVPFTPTAVLQGAPASGAALGTVEYAYTDNIGRVVIGHQSDVDSFGSLQWTVVSGNEAFSGTPALNTLSDGRTQLTAQNTDSDVWATSQTETSAPTWNAWSDLGGSMAAPPAAIRLSTGVTVLFAIDIDGDLWAYAQTGTVPYWKNLGNQSLVGTPGVAATRDGVQIFARDTTGAVQTAEYVDGSISAWTNLGGAGATSAPSVVVYPGYRLRVFVRAADGTIATKAQDSTGAFATAWETLGTYVSGGAPAAILDPIVGRIAVVTRDPSGIITVAWETAQGSGVFGAWDSAIQNLDDPAATDPTVAPMTNSDGQRWVIAFRNANNASRVYVSGVPTSLTALTTSTAGAFTAYTLPTPPA